MLTHLLIRNLKRFDDVAISLGPSVVFIGPNNSGKTTALQALALWQFGLGAWLDRRKAENTAQSRVGVTVNRKDIVSLPVPQSIHLWRNLSAQTTKAGADRKHTDRVKIEVELKGEDPDGAAWSLGMRFHYAGPETLRCEPFWPAGAPPDAHESARRIAAATDIQLLPPMSGLANSEVLLQEGAIQLLLGQGKSADVLRNLCWAVYTSSAQASGSSGSGWTHLTRRMSALFGVAVHPPQYIDRRGEIALNYTQNGAKNLDISAAGRGMQQTLLLLAWLYRSKPGSVLLLDEPDAHLEILRQQEIYGVLKEVAHERGCQIVAASHSEVILNEAARLRDTVVSFVGRPHLMDSRDQTRKALMSIGFENYIKAEQTGWVLYLEGPTDLEILRAFAERIDHGPARTALARPFVHFIQQPHKARDHFFGVRDAKPDLVGLVVMDQLPVPPAPSEQLPLYCWTRREIENYFATPEVLHSFAEALAGEEAPGVLFENARRDDYARLMDEIVRDQVSPKAMRERADPWWRTMKASDDLLDPVFAAFARRLGRSAVLRKGEYHRLVAFLDRAAVDPEVIEMLDRIAAVAASAHPIV